MYINMKRHFVLWLSGWFILLGMKVSAQQIPISSIFMENPFAFNPAVAGTESGADKGFRVKLNSRMQWLGFNDAPFTNQLSAFGPHKTRPIGYGGNIVQDKTGPTSTFKVNGAFSTNFAVSFDMRISLALNLGFLQYRADGTQFEFVDGIDDPFVKNAMMSSFQPDAGAGVYVYHHDWYFGLSAQQLFNNNVKLVSNGENSKRNRLKPHFFGYAGYKFQEVNQRWIIEPSILAKQVVGLPLQMDFCGRVIYRKQFWGGISARNTFESFDNLNLVFGYIHEQRISISMAFDFSFAQIRNYSAGTIELVFGYKFDTYGR